MARSRLSLGACKPCVPTFFPQSQKSSHRDHKRFLLHLTIYCGASWHMILDILVVATGGLGVEQILDFWQNLPEFPFSTRHYQWSFFFEFELGRFDHHIHWFFILANITGSHFNNFSISEIIFIFALCFLPISNPHPMIVHRKVKPCDQKQRVSSRDQEFFWQKFLVFL